MSKYFPIVTETACQLKWTWSTVFLYTGTTSSCHRIVPDHYQSFDAFHNTPKKLADRQLMLNGQWPTGGCEYCQRIEAVGGFSDRMLHNSIPDLTPKELANDPTATEVTPRILEIYLNNTCNFACLYCNGMLSSKINYENSKYENTNTALADSFTHVKIDDVDHFASLVTWLETNYIHLKRLHVLGGEPFYQKEFEQLLDFLSTHANPELELNIVTNLGIAKEKLQGYIQQIKKLVAAKKIRRLDLTCSIDCWGPEQEYVRQGLDLKLWEDNFNYLLTEKWLVLNINQTISVLTIKTMPDLLRKLAEWRKLRPVGHFFSGVTPGPEYMKPHILGGDIFAQDFEQIINLMDSSTDQTQASKQYMQGIWLHIKKNNVNINELDNLKAFLTEIDRRRKTNWKELFSWIP